MKMSYKPTSKGLAPIRDKKELRNLGVMAIALGISALVSVALALISPTASISHLTNTLEDVIAFKPL